MKTRKFFIGAAFVGALGMLALGALNATAQPVTIDTNLSVTPNVISFETVFPGEVHFRPLDINLSGSFIESPLHDDVEYRILQRPKPRVDSAIEREYCGANPTDYTRCYRSLCPYLSKEPDGTPGNDTGVAAYHDPNASSSIAYGRLAKSENDEEDSWTIDLHTPCFRGECDQTKSVAPEYQLDAALNGERFGCDLIVEVTGVSFYRAKLIVIKRVTNNNGGTAVPGDFRMTVSGHNPTPATFAGAGAPGTDVIIEAGNYSVSESGPSGYAASYSSDCTGSISNGEIKTCTVTNDDIPPSLTLVKRVINNNGGTRVASDWTLRASGPTPISGAGNVSSGQTFSAGTYVLSETGPAGYASSTWACERSSPAGLSVNGEEEGVSFGKSSNGEEGVIVPNFGDRITLGLGEHATCTIVNDDIPAACVARADFDRDAEGQAILPGQRIDNEYAPWGLTMVSESNRVPGGNRAITFNSGNPTGTSNEDLGTPNQDFGGLGIGAGGRSGQPGQNNIAQRNVLVVAQELTDANNDGYVDVPDDEGQGGKHIFTFTSETTINKIRVFDVDSAEAARVRLFALNGTEFRTITIPQLGNNSAQTIEINSPGVKKMIIETRSGGVDDLCFNPTTPMPRLTVIKRVINDNGGIKRASDFKMIVTGTNVQPTSTFPGNASGTVVTLTSGSYSVDEAAMTGYTKSKSAECNGTISNGQTKTCTITNDDIALVVTRTSDFWKTHTNFTSAVFQANFPTGMKIGTSTHVRLVTNTTGTAQSRLFGAYYSSISKKTNNNNRDSLDQARMRLLQHLVTAKLNCAALGCAASVRSLITSADVAYAGNNTSQINTLKDQLDSYNNSGDANPIPPALGNPGPATPSTSQTKANKVYWDNP